MIQFKYLNNNIFRYIFIGVINIITHAIFMKILSIKTSRVSVLGTYKTSRYMLIT